jgi:hypothetical protein
MNGMPVIISPEHYQQWLDKSTDETQAFELLDNQAYTFMTTIVTQGELRLFLFRQSDISAESILRRWD